MLLFLIIILFSFFIIISAIISKNREINQDVTDRLYNLNRMRKQNEINLEEYKLKNNLCKEVKYTNLKGILKNKIVWIIILLALTIIGMLVLSSIGNLTGNVIGGASKSINTPIFFIFLIGIVAALAINYRSIILNKFKKKIPKNDITGLVSKEVYSESGHYIGKVDDIILSGSRIDSLKIELDKKYKFDKKGIIVNYLHVKSISEIVIIEEKVEEYLENSRKHT